MELETLNLDQICRTCKSVTPQMLSLFEWYKGPHQGPRIDEMLMACTSVQVICGDGLPNQICQVCVEQVTNAFNFKQQCEKVDENLREYAKNVKVYEIKQELQSFDYMESTHISNVISEETTQDDTNIPKIETDSELDHLQRHEQSHSHSKAYVCRICSKTLTTIKHLKRHLLTHLSQKPLSCNTCNRRFNRIEHQQNHTPTCKGDIVYPCDVCNKAFSREDSLEVHKAMHDNETSKVLTIESLDNIEDYYYQIDQDVDTLFSENTDVDDCLELQMDDNDIKDVNGLHNEVLIIEGTDSDVDKATGDLEENEEHVESEYIKVEEIFEPDEPKILFSVEDCGDSTDFDNAENPDIRLVKKIQQEYEEYGEFPCPSCQEKFDTITLLDKHAKMKHKGLKVHKCGVCNKRYSRACDLKKHLTSHSTNKLYKCQLCTKGFNRRDHFNKHLKVHERSNDLECDVCQKAFNRADYLAKHKASVHGIGETVVIERKYECPLCFKSFTKERNRDVHVNAHGDQKEYRCRVCEKTFPSKPRLTEHLKVHDENAKKFGCTECGQKFIRNDFLVIHMRRHRGEKPFKCEYCGKGFLRTTDLTIHEKYHTGEKTHLCTICGKGFIRAQGLTVHMRTHTGEKPFQCTYCDAAFTQGHDLKMHERRHTGQRYQCELCSDSFFTKYLLTQHKRTVHGLNVSSHIRRLQPVFKH